MACKVSCFTCRIYLSCQVGYCGLSPACDGALRSHAALLKLFCFWSASGHLTLIFLADALLSMQIVETTVKGTSKKMDSMGQLIEAVLGQDLAHPNVVQTYKHTTRVAPQVRRAGWLQLLACFLLSVSLRAAPAPA